MTSYWDRAMETLPREDLADLQLERLQMTLHRAYTKVDFYRQSFDGIGLQPEDVQSLEELHRLPFTTATDLAEHYPYGLFSVPLKSIVRLKFPTALRGRPSVIGYTQRDTQTWLHLMARYMTAVGIGSRDIVQVAFNYSLFTGAFTFNQAAELIGAMVAPTSVVSATLQLQIMQDFRSTVLATSPAFALHIAETRERLGREARPMFLRVGIFGPEAMPPAVRRDLEERLSLKAYAVYGVNEMVEPGVAWECLEKAGLHVAEDHFLPEVIDPETRELLPPGREGELVITTLTNEAHPLIRFRTGDMTTFDDRPCPCGRTSVRMTPALNRSDGLLTVRGIALYPDHLARVVGEVAPEAQNYRLHVRKRHGLNDQLEIQVGLAAEQLADWSRSNAIAESIRSHLRRATGLGIKVRLVDRVNLPAEPGQVVFED
jgi:phenylacetate-CoA ligase